MRELREELGIAIVTRGRCGAFATAMLTARMLLDVWVVRRYQRPCARARWTGASLVRRAELANAGPAARGPPDRRRPVPAAAP